MLEKGQMIIAGGEGMAKITDETENREIINMGNLTNSKRIYRSKKCNKEWLKPLTRTERMNEVA